MTSSITRPFVLILTSISFGLVAMLLWRSALLDVGGFQLGAAESVHQLRAFASTWRFWLGVLALVVVVLITIDLWANEELSKVLPLYSISYVAIALIGKFYLGEEVGSSRWLAIALIIVGVNVLLRT
jgi:drug/metabolite transporter (DMT)-like permease